MPVVADHDKPAGEAPEEAGEADPQPVGVAVRRQGVPEEQQEYEADDRPQHDAADREGHGGRVDRLEVTLWWSAIRGDRLFGHEGSVRPPADRSATEPAPGGPMGKDRCAWRS